jgi:sec-independent protein translocase protein TatB
MWVPQTIQVASIGIPDTMFLMLLALVVFGPRRLPEIGRQIGKLMYEFRKVSNDFKFQMEEELRASEEASRQEKLAAAAPVQPVLAASGADAIQLEPANGIGSADSGMNGAVTHGEVSSGPVIQPPSTGDPIAGLRPFRGYDPAPVVEVKSEAEPSVIAEQESHHA